MQTFRQIIIIKIFFNNFRSKALRAEITMLIQCSTNMLSKTLYSQYIS